jgi:hypothetical protein
MAKTGYPGDELALCAPDAADGMLIHMGPSDYSDPTAMAPYILAAGGEEEFCIHVNTTNTEQKFYEAYHGRMRPLSHHWIVTMPTKPTADEQTPTLCGPQIIDRWLFGSQKPQMDVERVGGGDGLAKPGDPDYGAAHDIPPLQTMLMDLHYVNTTQEPILREAWAVLNYVDPADVKVHVDLITFNNVAINIPAMAHAATPKIVCNAPSTTDPVYLGLATAHAHQRLQKASVWHEKADGTEELVYQSDNWHEQGEAYFRDGVQNPALPVTGSATWGAMSGYLKVLPGESLSFQCEYQNDQTHTVTFGDTTKDEMCELFGFYYPTTGKMWTCF